MRTRTVIVIGAFLLASPGSPRPRSSRRHRRAASQPPKAGRRDAPVIVHAEVRLDRLRLPGRQRHRRRSALQPVSRLPRRRDAERVPVDEGDGGALLLRARRERRLSRSALLRQLSEHRPPEGQLRLGPGAAVSVEGHRLALLRPGQRRLDIADATRRPYRRRPRSAPRRAIRDPENALASSARPTSGAAATSRPSIWSTASTATST